MSAGIAIDRPTAGIPCGTFATFRIGAGLYAIDVRKVSEIVRAVEIVPVPLAPSDVLGIAEIRGAIATILDVARSLGTSRAEIVKDVHDVAGRMEGGAGESARA
ncbi:MAG: chemotaxis protein CheW, partial [Planctomycetes bacterium]|nr:chemotaxis protein CheW [Planctomycetota bacterium]